MLPGLSQNSRRKNLQLLNLSTERTTKGQNKMDEKINLATLDIEYIKLIDRVLNATPEQREKIEQLINE